LFYGSAAKSRSRRAGSVFSQPWFALCVVRRLEMVVNAYVICCRGLVRESICVDGWFIHHTSKDNLILLRPILSFGDVLTSCKSSLIEFRLIGC